MAKAAAVRKEIDPYEMDGRFGILNHLGQFWSCETFSSIPQAQKYIDEFQAENKHCDLSRHEIIPVNVTITAAE
jgi:hypothetical protein